MSSDHLANLNRIGLLDAVPFSDDLFRKMLATAESRITDAMRAENSSETRFDCAYTAIRATADAALLCLTQAKVLLQLARRQWPSGTNGKFSA